MCMQAKRWHVFNKFNHQLWKTKRSKFLMSKHLQVVALCDM